MCMEMEGSDALKCIQTVKKIMKKRERGYLSDIGINAQIKLFRVKVVMSSYLYCIEMSLVLKNLRISLSMITVFLT